MAQSGKRPARFLIKTALYGLAVLFPPLPLLATRQWLNGSVNLFLVALSWLFGLYSLGIGAPIMFGALAFTILHALMCLYLHFEKG